MDMNSTTLEMALVEWTDQETADRFKSDYTIKGEVKKFPKQLEQAFILTGVKLSSYDKFGVEEKGLITSNTTAILLNMYEKPVMKFIPMKVFFQQQGPVSGGDRLGVYFDIPGGYDYYFDYRLNKKDGEMRIITGDKELADGVNSIKEDKRKTKNFKYEISTQGVYKSRFLGLFDR